MNISATDLGIKFQSESDLVKIVNWTAGMVSPFILKANYRILINYEYLSVQLVLIKLLFMTKLFSSKRKNSRKINLENIFAIYQRNL